MIKEYLACTSYTMPSQMASYESPMTIALHSVATAQPLFDSHTLITLHGHAMNYAIRESYDRFVRDWQSVKRPG